MKLRTKTLIVIGATLVGLNAFLYTISSTILSRSLARAEEQGVRQSVKGVVNVFAQTQDDFNSVMSNWSSWDDAYNFIEHPNKDFVKAALVPEALAVQKINLIVFIHSSGRIVYTKGVDLKTLNNIPIPAELREHLALNRLLVHRPNAHSSLTGILLLPEGPMRITSQPILTTRGSGPSRGSLIIGRYLHADGAIENLAKITGLHLTVYRVNDAQMPPNVQAVRDSLSENEPIVVRPLSKQTIAGYTLLPDIYGKPALLLQVDVPREIYQQGELSQGYLIASLLLVGLVFSGITLLLLERLVLLRLASLSADVRSISQLGDLSMRVLMKGKDELSSLAGSINQLLQRVAEYTQELSRKNQQLKLAHDELSQKNQQLKLAHDELTQTLDELQQTQAQLIQTEKMSSLGQMVAGVAHEINNPVNFIYGNLDYANNYIQDLLELVHLYEQLYPNPIPAIQHQTTAIDLEFLTEDLPKVLSSMKMGAERIRQIVLSLRNFSRLDEAAVKLVNIHEGIDSTLLLLNHRLKQGVEVIKKYGELPLVECYPAQLNQVFMNILSNAIDALLEQAQQPNKQIRICTEVELHQIRIRIWDNGPGIPPENLDKIFNPFFTTKDVGKGTGLGLSICYQIVKKHLGQISVSSPPGKGTEFAIALPIQQPSGVN